MRMRIKQRRMISSPMTMLAPMMWDERVTVMRSLALD